jgi:hypothetical protein
LCDVEETVLETSLGADSLDPDALGGELNRLVGRGEIAGCGKIAGVGTDLLYVKTASC